MAFNVAFDNINAISFDSLFRKSTIARLALILKILFALTIFGFFIFVVVGAINTGIATHAVVSKLENQVSAFLDKSSDPTTLTQPDVDYSIIAERNIFGSFNSNSSKPKQAPAPASTASLSLIGTFVSDTDEEPQTIIENTKKKTQDVFYIGDMIFGEAKLLAIYADRVEIERQGKREVLTLDETPDSSGSAPSTSGINEEELVVDETELNEALNDLPMLLTQARAVPYFKDGKAVGLRLFAIKTGSLYDKVGLKNGDILKKINGSSLGDMTQAMKLFERLKEERSIRLILERNRKEKVIHYKIQ